VCHVVPSDDEQLLLAGLDGFLATRSLYMLGVDVAPPT
jgi:hypothetical protein